MTETMDPTAWSALLLGLFTLAAAIGALRNPGSWKAMMDEIERSPALQMLCGFAEMIAGAILYLANPWVPDDILTCIMKAIGGFMMVEALAVTAMSDVYFQFWLKSFTRFQRGWALFTLLLGIGLVTSGMLRIG
nr:hypothetical protein [uncultured Sphingomonas sp.]